MTDLAIIGAGPAGMAAAAKATEIGLRCTVLDEQAKPGGQIYRAVTETSPQMQAVLGDDYAKGAQLATQLEHPSVTYLPGSVIWQIDPDNRITFTGPAGPQQISPRHILLATGALERPVPIPGWTLPGVMTAGAGQILLKQSGLMPENAVLVGCGPLLYLLAVQLIRAGTPPLALIELQSRPAYIAALAHMLPALRNIPVLQKGRDMLREIRQARVPRFIGAEDPHISGTDCATGITFRHRGASHHLDADTVLLHAGVTPNIQITSALGLAHRWYARNQCFEPMTDTFGAVPDRAIHIAGDGAGIAGADAAKISGALAAVDIGYRLGHLTAGKHASETHRLRRGLDRENAIRPFLETLFAPPADILTPADDTILCRCEEVTAGTVRQIAKAGCVGPNQAKSFCRAGMGACQGRYCGATTTQVLAQANGRSPTETGHLNQRFPTKPVTLGELAMLDRHS